MSLLLLSLINEINKGGFEKNNLEINYTMFINNYNSN